MKVLSWNRQGRERGFTIIEMLIATLVMVVGVIGVAQLIPMSVRLNTSNRNDSTALVFAQRELDQMVGQPLSATTFSDPQGVMCPPAANCSLGNPATPRVPVGNAVVMFNSRPLIDFTAAPVAGYNFTYADPNDPFQVSYSVRWAVITYSNGANPTGKRFIVGVRRTSGNRPLLPVTLDAMVEK